MQKHMLKIGLLTVVATVAHAEFSPSFHWALFKDGKFHPSAQVHIFHHAHDQKHLLPVEHQVNNHVNYLVPTLEEVASKVIEDVIPAKGIKVPQVAGLSKMNLSQKDVAHGIKKLALFALAVKNELDNNKAANVSGAVRSAGIATAYDLVRAYVVNIARSQIDPQLTQKVLALIPQMIKHHSYFSFLKYVGNKTVDRVCEVGFDAFADSVKNSIGL